MIEQRVHVVTCHTEGCGNGEIGIEVINPEGLIQCGPCGEYIDDIVPPIPESEEEGVE